MAEFKIKVKNESNIKDKPRVYFTCHPRDFDAHFERICADLFKTQDCAIYYTADMSEPLSEENLSLDINRMNLVVVPITLKLLVEDNRAMSVDIPYAMNAGVPVLPLMMEGGIVEIYSRPDRFGERQFITPDSREKSEIAYDKKLSDFLDGVLTSGEVAKRVRAAFDAYVFLSYRKKDRVLANELMRLIHENPKYRDIAIWYDEFLSPGESFRENITRALSDSRLFALLVTPNLLETPNFVMDEEYPAARKSGKPVLPVEMAQTDKDELFQRYEEIPKPVSGCKREAVYERLAEMLVGIALSENDNDPEHLYLIGLAYLHGIDVEVNRERGIALITKAADAGWLEAMAMLAHLSKMYDDDPQMLKWTEKIYEYHLSQYGEEDPKTLDALGALADAYHMMDGRRAFELSKKGYDMRCRIFGELHPDTLLALQQLALLSYYSGDTSLPVKLYERLYEATRALYGENHPKTFDAYSSLVAEVMNSDIPRGMEMATWMYEKCVAVFGKSHMQTVEAAGQLATFYLIIGDPEAAYRVSENVYIAVCNDFGEECETAVAALDNMICAVMRLDDDGRAVELYEKNYTLHKNLYGEWDERTFDAMMLLTSAYYGCGWGERGYMLLERAYAHVMGLCERDWASAKNKIATLASTYLEFRYFGKAVELAELNYAHSCEFFGETHPKTLGCLDTLSIYRFQSGDTSLGIELRERHVALCERSYGENHFLTLTSLQMLASNYEEVGDIEAMVSVLEQLCERCAKTPMEKHPQAAGYMRSLGDGYRLLGRDAEALPLYRKAYDIYVSCYGDDAEFVIEFRNLIDALERMS